MGKSLYCCPTCTIEFEARGKVHNHNNAHERPVAQTVHEEAALDLLYMFLSSIPNEPD